VQWEKQKAGLHIPIALHGTVLQKAGLIHMLTAQLETEHTVAQSMFKQALRLAKQADEEENPQLKFDCGYIHLSMAEALTTRHHPVTLKEHLDEAAKLIDPAFQRRHLMVQVLRAQGDIINAKYSSGLKRDRHYGEATELAIEALRLAKTLESRVNRDRILGIYQQLMKSPYQHEPMVARLGLMLANW